MDLMRGGVAVVGYMLLDVERLLVSVDGDLAKRGVERAAQSNTPDCATRRAEEEGGRMLFVPERRRSRRVQRRDPRRASLASEAINVGSGSDERSGI